MLNDKLTREILCGMDGMLNNRQMDILRGVLARAMKDVRVLPKVYPEEAHKPDNGYLIGLFLSSKGVEGCSERTLRYYRMVIGRMDETVGKEICEITTDDLRQYLGDYQAKYGSGRVTLDNIRRVLSSFFGWLEDEDFILKSPVRRIHKIKAPKVVQATFSDENLEQLQGACSRVRDLALVEMLISTGMRVGELVRLDRTDVNFAERSCVVLGKGDAQREVYFDARAKLHLQEYLAARTDADPALFVSLKAPHGRLGIGGAEALLKRLGAHANIEDVHPHKFRRTLATMAIDKGMPIEQVQRLLGHVRIDTTMHYAQVNQANVKNSHRKFIS